MSDRRTARTDNRSLRQALDTRQPGFSLPALLYRDPDAFDVDVEVFFHRHWVCVGPTAQAAEPGDVVKVDLGRASILIARGQDGVLRAFHNVCRHRGSHIQDCDKARVRRLVCPYHQWSYELTGELAVANYMGDGFEKAGITLTPVQLRDVGGLLFICLDDDAPADLGDFAAAMVPRLEPFHLGDTKIAHQSEIIEEGNWKLVIENNRECYHCAVSHPELNRSFAIEDFVGYDTRGLTPREAVRAAEAEKGFEAQTHAWESMGFVSRLAERQRACATPFRTQRLRIAGAGESQTMDTKVASTKLLGGITDRVLGDLHLWTHSSWHHFMSDHAVSLYVVPLSPDRTLLRSFWMVAKDAVEGIDYDVENLTRVWTSTNAEDAVLVKRTQLGIESPAYQPGPYSTRVESYVENFTSWYVERLRAHGY
ncbi:MAG TPA: aromatic ring-hydroxylating dioxygenase subunit alpha [Gemmatimonadaceae bacterium]|nr:aromatic ring-hydroxylating dioxygenase subunit alpha [Gemmatimonadaceae bacterium]